MRAQVLERLKATLGEPEVSHGRDGEIDRWTLPRLYDLNMHITLGAPARSDLPHIMICDTKERQGEAVVSVIIRRIDEIEPLIARIKKQWHSPATAAKR